MESKLFWRWLAVAFGVRLAVVVAVSVITTDLGGLGLHLLCFGLLLPALDYGVGIWLGAPLPHKSTHEATREDLVAFLVQDIDRLDALRIRQAEGQEVLSEEIEFVTASIEQLRAEIRYLDALDQGRTTIN